MSTHVKWGLITGMVYVIFSLLNNLFNFQQNMGLALGLLVNTILFGITFYMIFLGVKETRDQNLGGYINVGQAIRSGMGIALIAGIVSALFTVLYMKVIDPGMADKIMAMAEAQMDEKNVPEDQRELSRKLTGFMVNPFFAGPIIVIWASFWGLIKSLIAGQLLKREAPPTFPTA